MKKIYKKYYLLTAKTKIYNNMIDGTSFWSNKKIINKKGNHVWNDNIRKITTAEGDDNKTVCLLDYPFSKNTTMLLQ